MAGAKTSRRVKVEVVSVADCRMAVQSSKALDMCMIGSTDDAEAVAS